MERLVFVSIGISNSVSIILLMPAAIVVHISICIYIRSCIHIVIHIPIGTHIGISISISIFQGRMVGAQTARKPSAVTHSLPSILHKHQRLPLAIMTSIKALEFWDRNGVAVVLPGL